LRPNRKQSALSAWGRKVSMFDSRKALLFLCILTSLLYSGACVPAKQARVAAVALTVGDVARAAAKQSDPTIIKAGSPAYLMLIDGLIEAYPDNRELLTVGCQAYDTFASSFLEDSERHEASALYAKAMHYGFRALSEQGDFSKALSGTLGEFTNFLQKYDKDSVPALFWTATAWASWTNTNLDDLEALAELPMLEATMKRLLELDDSFYYGGPHLLLATYLAAKPAILGGNVDQAREHFEQALALGKGKLLMARVLYARY
jgi:hypothetical protein